MRRKVICRATTRKGTPCQCKALPNGRCRLHGGLSTGPRTQVGKRRVIQNLPWARRL
ncbi:MAG: HGGxSTG domain-containing protein [Gammaproteobacteria bacterium]